MNLVGKVFTVLIFMMSILFMSFSLTLYSVHRDWEAVMKRPDAEATPTIPAGLRIQQKSLQDENRKLEEDIARLKKEQVDDLELRRQSLAKAEQASLQIEQSFAQLVQQFEAAASLLEKTVADFKKTQEEENAVRTEVVALQKNLEDTQNNRDDELRLSIRLTDQLYQAYGEWDLIRARFELLAAAVKAYTPGEEPQGSKPGGKSVAKNNNGGRGTSVAKKVKLKKESGN